LSPGHPGHFRPDRAEIAAALLHGEEWLPMKITIGASVTAAVLLLGGVAVGSEKVKRNDFASREYLSRCAGCHGVTGHGDGPNQAFLDRNPPDLTLLAQRNGGAFPYELVSAVIDGRHDHDGTDNGALRDMPRFGMLYVVSAGQDAMDVPYDVERYVETRVSALVRHLVALQATPLPAPAVARRR
jgi:mono/diheme cytochrome c family protein